MIWISDMRRWGLLLAVLPALLFGTVVVLTAPKPKPPPVKAEPLPVRPVRVVSFVRPPEPMIQTVVDEPLAEPEPVPLPPSKPPYAVRRSENVVRHSEDNICTRHNLRKVVTNGGRSWRCRR
jgi:hypothetical protein